MNDQVRMIQKGTRFATSTFLSMGVSMMMSVVSHTTSKSTRKKLEWIAIQDSSESSKYVD